MRRTGSVGRPGLPWGELAIVLACAALALWAQRRSLGGFFSLDDLVVMEEARGLRPGVTGLWRLISHTVHVDVLIPLFGARSLPYHVVSLLIHATNVALLYSWVRSRAGTVLGAAVTAGLFGASRLHMTALGSVSTIGEPLSLAFTLVAFLLHDRGRPARLAAAALFACALLGKETVALLPVVLLLPEAGAGAFRDRLRRAAPLLGLGVMFAIVLIAAGTGETHLGGKAYARAFGPNVALNLWTYTAWAVEVRDPFVGYVSGIDPAARPVGVAATAVLVLLAVLVRSGPWLPAFGALWWWLSLVPVLPLLHHTYLHYLYVPLAGMAMAIGATLSKARVWMGHPRAGALLGVFGTTLVLAHAWNADRLLAQRFAARVPGTGIPFDAELRKSEIARHAFQGVGPALGGRRARVAFLLPAALQREYSTETGMPVARSDSSGRTYNMLSGALDDGRGLRALLPNIDSVAFLAGWEPGYGDFEMFTQGSSGRVFPIGRGADGYAAMGGSLTRGNQVHAARALLATALSEFPDHAPLRLAYAEALYVAGDSLAMLRELEELVRRTPDHALTERVRAGLRARGRGE